LDFLSQYQHGSPKAKFHTCATTIFNFYFSFFFLWKTWIKPPNKPCDGNFLFLSSTKQTLKTKMEKCQCKKVHYHYVGWMILCGPKNKFIVFPSHNNDSMCESWLLEVKKFYYFRLAIVWMHWCLLAII
jgi:hypothetical protein